MPHPRLTTENIKEPLKEIRRALLEADVSLPVVSIDSSMLANIVLGIGLRMAPSRCVL